MSAEKDRWRLMRWCTVGIPVGLLAVLVVGIGVGRTRQRSLMAAIEELGGVVRTEPLAPQWMRDPAVDYFMRGTDPVVRVRLSRRSISDLELERFFQCLEKLPDLQTLRAARMPITDAELERIVQLPQLTALDLEQTQITDRGIPTLKRLTRLGWLILDRTAVTDAGVKELRGMQQLEMVSLEGTHTTDAIFATLETLPILDAVYLKGTGVTDPGVDDFQERRPSVRIVR